MPTIPFPGRPLVLALLAPLALAACADEADVPPVDADGVEAAVEDPEVEADTAALGSSMEAIVPLNLNTATEEEFMTVPNVGERMAHEFEEYRPWTSIEQFRREIGKYVDDDQVAAYEPYVYVPIDVEAASAATLQQLPGVGAAEAQALVDGRPYASSEAFLDAYLEAVPDGDRAAAAGYLAE